MFKQNRSFALLAVLMLGLAACSESTGYASFSQEVHPMNDFRPLDF